MSSLSEIFSVEIFSMVAFCMSIRKIAPCSVEKAYIDLPFIEVTNESLEEISVVFRFWPVWASMMPISLVVT